MKTWLPCLLPLFLLACGDMPDAPEAEGPPPGPPFRFDIAALPAHMQPWFTAAADEWNAATGKTLVIVDPEGRHRAQTDSNLQGRGRAELIGETWLVSINPPKVQPCDAFDKGLRAVFLHELGHVFGAEFPGNPADPAHSELSADMLFKTSTVCGHLTSRDIAAIAY